MVCAQTRGFLLNSVMLLVVIGVLTVVVMFGVRIFVYS